MALGRIRHADQVMRLRMGGEYVDIVWEGDPDDNSAYASLMMLFRNGPGGAVYRKPSGERIFVNWAAVSTVQILAQN